MGLRLAFMMDSDGGPFKCSSCDDRTQKIRNCGNLLSLSERSRAVTCYSEDVSSELSEKGASKVFTLGDIRMYECPVSFVTEDTREIMGLVTLIDSSGHLLKAGSWAEQPFWLVEGYKIFKREGLRYGDK